MINNYGLSWKEYTVKLDNQNNDGNPLGRIVGDDNNQPVNFREQRGTPRKPPMPRLPPRDALLRIAFRHALTAADAEAGVAQVAALAPALSAGEIHAAIADCLARRLIDDPIRLTGLHCHWRLTLTPAGVAAARTLAAQD